jgi:hypothetical protein
MAGVPGRGGPPPKRSTQRRRKNKIEGLQRAAVAPMVRGAALRGDHSEEARRFWRALRRSGQAEFFQPSDWAAAELVVVAIDAFVRKPSAMMLSAINQAMSNLLVTEADRRRVRLELELPDPDPVDDAADPRVAKLARIRGRVASAS